MMKQEPQIHKMEMGGGQYDNEENGMDRFNIISDEIQRQG